MVTIQQLTAAQATARLSHLAELLIDSVEHGASVGFLSPLSTEEATAYWQGVIQDLAQGSLLLWAALVNDELAGSVQLHPSPKRNGSHRAEVAKLLVHTTYRRQGIGRALMQELEDEARRRQRTTLFLDTRLGEPSEQLYAKAGYIKAGEIPDYARSADGTLHPTVIYYKLLS